MSSHSSEISRGLPSPPSTPSKKPPNPYTIGATFVAKRHEPPAPFGGRYSDDPFPYLGNLPHLDQLKWCISHPPAQGKTFPEDTLCVNIIEPIRTGKNCGAQVLLTDIGLVAKIYDPLYYAFHVSDFPRNKIDVSAIADSDYSIETAAYSEIQDNGAQGSIMPKYYGSWTLDVMHCMQDTPVTRQVRMILLEHLSGVSMLDIDPDGLTKEERENIMCKLIEADYDLRLAGVHHDDLSPRNVIISTNSDYTDPNMRLTLVDYGSSTIYRIRWGGPTLWCRHNPAFDWAAASMWSSWGWLPYNDEERINWVWSVWGDGRGGKYVKVERDPDDPLGCPIEPDLELGDEEEDKDDR